MVVDPVVVSLRGTMRSPSFCKCGPHYSINSSSLRSVSDWKKTWRMAKYVWCGM